MSERKYSITDELAKSAGFDMALMTSFNFEIPFFERAILNPLLANNVRKISVFIDAGEFEKSLASVNTSYLGRKYMVNPVVMPGAFHPKVILLLGEKGARLFIGSANFNTSGLMTNNEIFIFIDYTPQAPEYLDVINDAIAFFLTINERSFHLDDQLLKSMKDYTYYHRSAPNGHLRLLTNTKQAFLHQLSSLLPEDITRIRIAAPYYDNQLAAVQQLHDMFPDARTILYVQNKKGAFPVAYHKTHDRIADVLPFKGFKSGKDNIRENFYHGKVFLFQTKQQAYILYGSANCTWAALGKSADEGGNIECDFLESGDLHDFDYFFDDIDVQPGVQLDCQPLKVEAVKTGNYFFKYGKYETDIELTIGYYINKPDAKVFLAGKEISARYQGSEFIVNIPEDDIPALTDIFNIIIRYEGTEETLRCWTVNPTTLEFNRISLSPQKPLANFSLDPDSDKYMEDRYNLLNAEAMCQPEIENYIKNKAHYKQIEREKEEDSEEDESFIIDIDIPDEYRATYKQYQTIEQIRGMFLERFLEPAFNPFSVLESADSKPGKSAAKVSADAEPTVVVSLTPRIATTEEKRFERFVKSRVKGMMGKVYNEIIEPAHYLGVAAAVFDIFEKYHRDRVDDIFDNAYTLKTSADLFINFINAKSPCEYDSAVLIKCCKLMGAILSARTSEMDVDQRRAYDDIARALLMTIENKFHVRVTYVDFLNDLKTKEILSHTMVAALIPYIENLYGYKNLDMLKELIAARYTGAEITIKGKTLIIRFSSPEVNRYSQPDITVLSEINKYSRHFEKLATVKIIIKSSAADQPGKNNVVRIQHTIRLDYHNWQSTTTWKDGTVWDGKARYLEF